jgi:outer membrane protein, heavy metal efflux system
MKFILPILLVMPLVAEASQTDAPSCAPEMRTYRDVIACAELRSPEAQVVSVDVERSKAEVHAAGQWKNPEFSAVSVQGSSNGQSNSQTDLDLGIPIELGGKISARRAVAEGGVAAAEARAYEVRAKIKSEMLIKLHRLRQIYHEQEVIDEAIGTFTKLVNQFSKRPKLSPEQQLSYTVFRMSKSEYEIKRAETVEGLAALRAFFKVAVGKEIEELKNLTPESPKDWPQVGGEYKFGSSPKSKLANAELQTSQAALSLAQSEAWPTLTVGPAVQIQNQGGQSTSMFGINLSLPLPLFNMNGAGKAAAASGVSLSETRKSFALSEEEKHREEMLRVYNESKRVLGATLSHKEIEGRHQEIESLFFKGIVPSALVIEAHRTFVELEMTRNQRELKALESLLSIYTIDGKISELSL